jgi:hypothetical protein
LFSAVGAEMHPVHAAEGRIESPPNDVMVPGLMHGYDDLPASPKRGQVPVYSCRRIAGIIQGLVEHNDIHQTRWRPRLKILREEHRTGSIESAGSSNRFVGEVNACVTLAAIGMQEIYQAAIAATDV